MAGDGSRRPAQVLGKENGTVGPTEFDAVSVQNPAVLTPEPDEFTNPNAGISTFLNRPGGADVSAGDSQNCPTLDPSTSLGKRRRRDFRSQHEGEILKRTGSTVIEMLREALKAAEEWKTSLCANIDLMRTREEDLLAEIDAWKKNEILLLKERDKLNNKIAAQMEREMLFLKVRGDLIKKIAVHMERETLLYDVRGKLFDKIAVQNEREAAQNEREALLLQDREKLLHEIDVRKKTKTLLIQERKELLKEISGLKERQRLLEGYKEFALNTTNSRRKTKAVLLHVRNRLLDKIDAQKNTETILLQERTENINCFSKRIHAQKKRESQLLQERKIGEVKLCKALNKLRYHRDTVSDRTITTLWDVTKKVLALTMDVEDSQPIGDKIRTPRSRSRMKMPSTLPASWKQAMRIISRAEDAFGEAAKNWVRDRDCIEAMKISCREGLIEKILGRKERPSAAQAALRDILDESQTVERQPQTEHNILAAVELKDSEKKEARRKQNNPQRLETSPSRSPQETEVRLKRKLTQRTGISPPPSSDELKVPRSRTKPQRYGTSHPPPSERMKVPRERKQPQRYRTSP